jgi:hypothetical protein
MRAWSAIVQEFDTGGDRSTVCSLKNMEHKLLSSSIKNIYPGGITGFVCDYEDAFLELEEALNIHYDHDQRRMMLHLRN